MDRTLDDRFAAMAAEIEELRGTVERLTREIKALRLENDRLRKENEKLKAEARKGHRQAGRFSKGKKKQDPKIRMPRGERLNQIKWIRPFPFADARLRRRP